ncbi:MAG: aminomethyltransferase beta-barrel domain-containing protein [Planctomycetaceae bacterium]
MLGTKEDLAVERLEGHRLNWLSADVPERFQCLTQIRYQHTAAAADLSKSAMIAFWCACRAAVRRGLGQAVVFYDHDRVIGGGWIA